MKPYVKNDQTGVDPLASTVAYPKTATSATTCATSPG